MAVFASRAQQPFLGVVAALLRKVSAKNSNISFAHFLVLESVLGFFSLKPDRGFDDQRSVRFWSAWITSSGPGSPFASRDRDKEKALVLLGRLGLEQGLMDPRGGASVVPPSARSASRTLEGGGLAGPLAPKLPWSSSSKLPWPLVVVATKSALTLCREDLIDLRMMRNGI